MICFFCFFYQATLPARHLARMQTDKLFLNPRPQLSGAILTRASAAERQKCNKSVVPQQHLASVSPHIIVIRYTACFIHIQKVFFPQRDPKIRTKIISNILLITRELWCVPDPRGLAGSSVKSLFFLCIFLSNPSVPRVLY